MKKHPEYRLVPTDFEIIVQEGFISIVRVNIESQSGERLRTFKVEFKGDKFNAEGEIGFALEWPLTYEMPPVFGVKNTEIIKVAEDYVSEQLRLLKLGIQE